MWDVALECWHFLVYIYNWHEYLRTISLNLQFNQTFKHELSYEFPNSMKKTERQSNVQTSDEVKGIFTREHVVLARVQ
jgi:hypothetical protein